MTNGSSSDALHLLNQMVKFSEICWKDTLVTHRKYLLPFNLTIISASVKLCMHMHIYTHGS